MAALLYAGLVRAEPPDTASGAVYYFPTREAHELFGMTMKEDT